MDSMVGGGTTSELVTKTVKEFVALRGGAPSSVTIVSKMFVLGACSGVGVQVITPLGEIRAPRGGFTST
jgi:hypothetical protein